MRIKKSEGSYTERKIKEEPFWDTSRFNSEKEWEDYVKGTLNKADNERARAIILGGRRKALWSFSIMDLR